MNKLITLSLCLLLGTTLHAQNATEAELGRQGRLVAAVIILEAGGEGNCGMHSVANVIYNRANMDGKTAYNIVKAPKQFSCLNGMPFDEQAIAKAKDGWPKQWQYALNLVKWGERGDLPDVTCGAYFYQVTGLPKRKWHGQMTGRIGRHEFYRKAGK